LIGRSPESDRGPSKTPDARPIWQEERIDNGQLFTIADLRKPVYSSLPNCLKKYIERSLNRRLAEQGWENILLNITKGSWVNTYTNIVAVCLATALCGCAALQQAVSQPQAAPAAAPSTAGNNTQATKTSDGRTIQKIQVGDLEGEIIGAPAKNSKFAKLRIGMGEKQVEDLIGTPNDSHLYTTGKAFIPFYFGKDAYRFQTFYRKEGSLTFQGGGITGTSKLLIRVSVDTLADGYAHDDNDK
jgi:hypothetical protein